MDVNRALAEHACSRAGAGRRRGGGTWSGRRRTSRPRGRRAAPCAAPGTGSRRPGRTASARRPRAGAGRRICTRRGAGRGCGRPAPASARRRTGRAAASSDSWRSSYPRVAVLPADQGSFGIKELLRIRGGIKVPRAFLDRWRKAAGMRDGPVGRSARVNGVAGNAISRSGSLWSGVLARARGRRVRRRDGVPSAAALAPLLRQVHPDAGLVSDGLSTRSAGSRSSPGCSSSPTSAAARLAAGTWWGGLLLGVGAFQLYDGRCSTSCCGCTRSATGSTSRPTTSPGTSIAVALVIAGAVVLLRARDRA